MVTIVSYSFTGHPLTCSTTVKMAGQLQELSAIIHYEVLHMYCNWENFCLKFLGNKIFVQTQLYTDRVVVLFRCYKILYNEFSYLSKRPKYSYNEVFPNYST